MRNAAGWKTTRRNAGTGIAFVRRYNTYFIGDHVLGFHRSERKIIVLARSSLWLESKGSEEQRGEALRDDTKQPPDHAG